MLMSVDKGRKLVLNYLQLNYSLKIIPDNVGRQTFDRLSISIAYRSNDISIFHSSIDYRKYRLNNLHLNWPSLDLLKKKSFQCFNDESTKDLEN